MINIQDSCKKLLGGLLERKGSFPFINACDKWYSSKAHLRIKDHRAGPCPYCENSIALSLVFSCMRKI
jgi:hypothetical protein